MKLAYLINQYPKVSHSFIRREILALEELGHEIFRFTIRPPGPDIVDPGDIEERNKTKVILSVSPLGLLWALLWAFFSVPFSLAKAFSVSTRLGRKSKRGILRHWAYLAEACILKTWLSKNGVEHTHAHFGTNSTTVAMLCKILGGPSFSFTAHGPEEFDDPVGLSLGEKIKHSKFVVGVSNFGCSQLMRQCPYRQWHKIKVVHCAVDNSFLTAAGNEVPDNQRVVCVGRLCEQKGQFLLLDAVFLLKKANCHVDLVLAGDGEMRELIETRIKELDLHLQVRITGWVNGEQVRKELEESRAMVLPSFAEGLPVVIMEALALGRPVISTYVAGIPELIQHGVNGFLVSPGSAKILADCLRKVLLTDSAKLTDMGREGARRVARDHNAIVEARKIAGFFENCNC